MKIITYIVSIIAFAIFTMAIYGVAVVITVKGGV
jgi:hypothetical protein